MGNCCAERCTCRVVAGTGTTITGNGSAANPYTISAGSSDPLAFAVQDSASVDLGLTGTGAAGDPYTVTADVTLDPSPPGGGTNLVQAGPDGLFVECEDVRGCLSAGDGIAYDPATGEIAARPSTDAGNAVTIGTDGGLFTPTAGGGTPSVVTAGDTPTANNTVTGTGAAGDPYVVSTDVILDGTPPGGGSNLAHAGPDGLYVECADVRGCLSAGDGIAYNPATGEIAADVSGDVGNATVIGTDGGLYTPAPDALTTACGLTGDGSAGDPLAASVAAWPYAGCDVDTYAGQVYCDSTGTLRGDPPSTATFVQQFSNQTYPATAVPVPTDTVVESLPFTVTNPDACRPAFVIFEVELDVDFTLPPGAAGEYGINGDDVVYMKNSGTSTQALVHVQSSKVYQRTIPPGGSIVEPFDVTMGDAIGSPTYSRIQTAHRAFVFNL